MAPSMQLLFGIVWLAASSEIITVVYGQPNSPDFITIDCGLAADGAYSDKKTFGLLHVPDTGFTDAGLNAAVRPPYYKPDWSDLYRTVRYFPDDGGGGAKRRSCYTLGPVSPGRRYLVRARFYYGNYDALEATKLPVFDIHIGVNRWTTVNITSPNSRHVVEAVTVPPVDFLQVCLVNTGWGTPFISGLELRPLGETMYPEATVNQSLLLLRLARPSSIADYSINRFHFGTGFIRYPADPDDRSWQIYKDPTWTNINTTDTVDIRNSINFDKPKILQSCATPENGTWMNFTWSPDPDLNDDNATYLLFLYFAELKRLPSNALRKFDILVDNATWKGSQSYTPKYLSAEVVKTMVQGSSQHAVSLAGTPDSTLPPILNAFEIYSVKPMTELATNDADVKAMMTIRTAYALKKNWMGDPCAPKSFAWDGLNCSYPSSGPASVTDLLLSSSGLAGEVHISFGDLKSLKYLDLSNNSLSGSIPDFLAQMPSLTFLDLSSNKLSGWVPAALLEKSQNRPLVFRAENNPNLCNNGASTCKSENKKRNKTIVITATVVPIALATLLFFAAFLIIRNMRSKRDRWTANSSMLNSPRDRPNILENRQFSYKELKLITANFAQAIGRGGFGDVFLGYLENGNPVAVKMRSKTSSQGEIEFLAEAQHLGRVHHKNIVSLIGYCKDKKHLALVYEYMHGGNLEDRLRGESSTVTSLTWPQRLKIALDSAHGLEYLHKSCDPPLIHRDVKTGNILLSADLEAKIADFGLMKVFADQFRTHVTTHPVGTLGYLDPEYYNTYQLSEKSDVYSFGVVLLELITGQPPAVAISDTESIHIAQWVRQKLSEGDIASIADRRMGGMYDVNSVWKVAELALQCKEQPSRKRPTMTDLVLELKECLELEVSSHAMTGYCSSSVQSTANISATSVDLHTAADQGTDDHPRQHAPIYLEQKMVMTSTSSVGPTPR